MSAPADAAASTPPPVHAVAQAPGAASCLLQLGDVPLILGFMALGLTLRLVWFSGYGLGDDIIFYASDVPHWDHDYPENVHELATREDLSPETRRKILYENTRRMYELAPAPPVT